MYILAKENMTFNVIVKKKKIQSLSANVLNPSTNFLRMWTGTF